MPVDSVNLTTRNHQNGLNTLKLEIDLIRLQLHHAFHEQNKTQLAKDFGSHLSKYRISSHIFLKTKLLHLFALWFEFSSKQMLTKIQN